MFPSSGWEPDCIVLGQGLHPRLPAGEEMVPPQHWAEAKGMVGASGGGGWGTEHSCCIHERTLFEADLIPPGFSSLWALGGSSLRWGQHLWAQGWLACGKRPWSVRRARQCVGCVGMSHKGSLAFGLSHRLSLPASESPSGEWLSDSPLLEADGGRRVVTIRAPLPKHMLGRWAALSGGFSLGTFHSFGC